MPPLKIDYFLCFEKDMVYLRNRYIYIYIYILEWIFKYNIIEDECKIVHLLGL